MKTVRIGCAGWALSAEAKPFFPSEGTHLERYARVFSTVEINSSFYRPHQPATYERWAESVPRDFRFTAKLPREITHERKLVGADAPLRKFLGEVTRLGDRLGVLLAQFPASFAFEASKARAFLQAFREMHAGRIAWEARHPTWFQPEALGVLKEFGVASVAADPAVVPAAFAPGGDLSFAYFRLHGSPRLYYSKYSPEFLEEIASRIETFAKEAYCIFDNTAEGAAIPNALELAEKIGVPRTTGSGKPAKRTP